MKDLLSLAIYLLTLWFMWEGAKSIFPGGKISRVVCIVLHTTVAVYLNILEQEVHRLEHQSPRVSRANLPPPPPGYVFADD